MNTEKFTLCWLPRLPVCSIKVLLDLDGLLDLANQGNDPSLANLVRLNWMVSHMRQHGMIKPIWCRGNEFETIVGDTRLMAAKLLGISEVPAFVYLTEAQGRVCRSQAEILALVGLGADARLYYQGTPDILTMPPSWVEIEHESTAGHGHDSAASLAAMRKNLESEAGPFTKDWVLVPRSWPGIFW